MIGASVALWVSIGALTVADDAMVSRMGLLPSTGWLALLIGAALLDADMTRAGCLLYTSPSPRD